MFFFIVKRKLYKKYSGNTEKGIKMSDTIICLVSGENKYKSYDNKGILLLTYVGSPKEMDIKHRTINESPHFFT